MILKLVNNNSERTVIEVIFENELDRLVHAHFSGKEKYITIDKGDTQEWTIIYEDGTQYSFNMGTIVTVIGRETANLTRQCTRLLNKNFIMPSEKCEIDDVEYIKYALYDDYVRVSLLSKNHNKYHGGRYNETTIVSTRDNPKDYIGNYDNELSVEYLTEGIGILDKVQDLPYNYHLKSTGKAYVIKLMNKDKTIKELKVEG